MFTENDMISRSDLDNNCRRSKPRPIWSLLLQKPTSWLLYQTPFKLQRPSDMINGRMSVVFAGALRETSVLYGIRFDFGLRQACVSGYTSPVIDHCHADSPLEILTAIGNLFE